MYNKKAVEYYEEGKVLQQQGKLSDAERAYIEAIIINQDYYEAHNNLGSVFLNQGLFEKAYDAYSKAQKLLPNHPMLLNNLGNALELQDEIEQAIGWYNKAITQDPAYVASHINLGNALGRQGRFEEAVSAYKYAIKTNPGFLQAYYYLGRLLVELNELDEAVINFKKVIQIDPGHKYANKRLANVLGDLGQLDEAVSSYRKAIDIDPEYAEAYRSLSNLKIFAEFDDDIHVMESLYASESISDEQKMHLAFGLGKAYEDLGDYKKSMQLILRATRLKRASFDYSISKEEELFSKIKSTFPTDFFSNREGMGNPDKTPIFILGMPRSGTSLVEQILASHPDVFGAGELVDLSNLIKKYFIADSSSQNSQRIVDLGTAASGDLGKEYIAGIRKYSKISKHITDKMPHNFLYIGLIRTILPNARVIHCTRDPMDNCLSILKNYFISGHEYSYDLTELGQFYSLYLDLMQYWRNALPGFIYDLSYEQLVADQENQIRQLIDYCDLPWDAACLDFHKTRRKVKTASKAQVRRPIYKDSVKLAKRYEKQLEPLRVAIYG